MSFQGWGELLPFSPQKDQEARGRTCLALNTSAQHSSRPLIPSSQQEALTEIHHGKCLPRAMAASPGGAISRETSRDTVWLNFRALLSFPFSLDILQRQRKEGKQEGKCGSGPGETAVSANLKRNKTLASVLSG